MATIIKRRLLLNTVPWQWERIAAAKSLSGELMIRYHKTRKTQDKIEWSFSLLQSASASTSRHSPVFIKHTNALIPVHGGVSITSALFLHCGLVLSLQQFHADSMMMIKNGRRLLCAYTWFCSGVMWLQLFLMNVKFKFFLGSANIRFVMIFFFQTLKINP